MTIVTDYFSLKVEHQNGVGRGFQGCLQQRKGMFQVFLRGLSGSDVLQGLDGRDDFPVPVSDRGGIENDVAAAAVEGMPPLGFKAIGQRKASPIGSFDPFLSPVLELLRAFHREWELVRTGGLSPAG